MRSLLNRSVKPATALAGAALLFSFSLAMFDSLTSLRLESIGLGAATIGLVSTGLSLLMFIGLLLGGTILQRVDEKQFWLVAVIGAAVGLLLGYAGTTAWVVIIAFGIVSLGQAGYIVAQAVLLRDNSDERELGRSQSLQCVLANIGWLSGPLIAGFTASAYGVGFPFIFASGFALLAALHFRNIKTTPTEHDVDTSVKEACKTYIQYFRDTNRVYAYFLRGGMTQYWGVIYTFTPLLLLSQGVSLATIGLFLAAIVVPLIVLEYFAGVIVDRIGHKTMFIVGYSVMGLATALMFFANTTWIFIMGIVGSIGSAMVEPTRDIYFFRITPKRDEERYIGTYLTASPGGSAVAKFLLSIVIVLFSLPAAFIGIGAIMFFHALLATRISEPGAFSVPSKEK